MATTTATQKIYDSWLEYQGDGTADHDDDTFICLLTTSAHSPNQATHTQISDITNELSGNGYARQTVAATWVEAAGTVTFDIADPVFTASGGSIVARWYHIFDDSTTAPVDALVCYGLLDNTPADVTTTDTNTLTVAINASGLYTVVATDV